MGDKKLKELKSICRGEVGLIIEDIEEANIKLAEWFDQNDALWGEIRKEKDFFFRDRLCEMQAINNTIEAAIEDLRRILG